MSDRYNTLDNSSPVIDPLKNPALDVPRSAFDFSRMVYMNGLFGAIMPFDVIRTLPNEDYTIQYDILAKLRNPLVRPLLNGVRIYIHTYFNRSLDLWEGSRNFYTKGRSGTENLTLPKIKFTNIVPLKGMLVTATPLAPSSYMGIPPMAYDNSETAKPIEAFKSVYNNDGDDNLIYPAPLQEFNALPFVMYERLCRDKYYPKNLLYKNKNIYPDNEEHFILPYDLTDSQGIVNLVDYDSPFDSNMNDESQSFVPDDESKCYLNTLHFRQFKGDPFTTANPFIDMIRGNIPTLNLSDINIDIESEINWDNVFEDYTSFVQNPSLKTQLETLALNNASAKRIVAVPDAFGGTNNPQNKSYLIDAFKKAVVENTVSGTASLGINLNDLRALEAYTIFMERNARTDGDYDSLIKAQFGYNPDTRNHEAIYIGGCYQDMVFSDVTQMSESSDSSPLGSRAGQGISAGSGYIGKFHSQDYGYIMSVMTILPDTIYTQNIDRMWTELEQSQQYFPILNNLSPTPITVGELMQNASSPDVLFGYQERYFDYKSRMNKALNFIGMPPDKAVYDSAQIMARRFDSDPTLSADFVTASVENVDMSAFSVSDEPPFDISIASRIDKVSPMPYITVPGGLNPRS